MRLSTSFEHVLRVVVCIFLIPSLVQMRAVVPMTGILINVVLAVTAVLATDWLGRFAQVPVIGRTVRRLQRIPAYYDEHPPRTVLYYLFYPFFFPYWLFWEKPRRELWLYRSFGTLTITVLLVTGLYEYFAHWRPHLQLRMFLAADLTVFVMQILITMVLVMPLLTTVVMMRGQPRRLIAIAVASLLFAAPALAVRKSDVPVMTMLRLRTRTQEMRGPTRAARIAALDAAWRHGPFRAGPVGGQALDDARRALEAAYQGDEAEAFELYATRDGVLVLYVPDEPGRMGMTRDRDVIEGGARLTR